MDGTIDLLSSTKSYEVDLYQDILQEVYMKNEIYLYKRDIAFVQRLQYILL